ncbi:MAG TPA: YicC family protein [Treponema sp.]|nr:MAG: YicC family protein [Treponema sp. GWC1_61_84]OHE72617.1 MAG: YicC family protein [Treponema sp. RIFOXYC1_FULL_61_9]HCM28041.1 YicC family protein [Treponema sp.]
MKSMTGYGYKEKSDERMSLSVELKSYNNRFLEIFVNLPPYLSPLEPRLREYVSSRCERGKVELSLRAKELSAAVSVSIDEGTAVAYLAAIRKLSAALGLDEPVRLSTILSLDGVLQAEKSRDPERYWSAVEPVLADAFGQFESARVREGAATEKDILAHLATLRGCVEEVSLHAPEMEAAIKDNIRVRFREVLGDAVDEARVLTETAVLLVKYSVSEELSRLRSHLVEFESETGRNSAPGKKLDFLCQEINREVNTIGSKSPVLEVSRAVIRMKDALENIREQLRNVE